MKRQWITRICFLVLAAGVIAGVSVFAGEHKVGAVTKVSIKQGGTKMLRWSKISPKNRKKIKWKSSSTRIVSVSTHGKIQAKRTGKAVITAKYQGSTHKYQVTVLAKSKRSKATARPAGKSPEPGNEAAEQNAASSKPENTTAPEKDRETVTAGTTSYRGFVTDNTLHSEKNGNIHYNVYIPASYDGTKEYALYVTLPGYQGLYFQGVAENIKTEDFGFEAQQYNQNMIIVAPQLNDWGQTSADQAIDLTEYFLRHYKIDPSKVYINGYSGGGETLSLVLGKRPELFAAALMCSSQWDVAYEPVVRAKTPVYFVIGESDEYYGSAPFKKAYQTLYDLYQKQGLSRNEIDKLLVLDVKGKDYFAGTKVTYQHGGGYLFCRDKQIMGWLFHH